MTNPELKMCEVTGFIYDCQGNPCSGVSVIITSPSRLPDNPDASQNIFVKQCISEVITDVNGMFQFSVAQGCWILVQCTDIQMNAEYQVPYKEEEDFNALTGFYRREKFNKGDPPTIAPGEWYSESV